MFYLFFASSLFNFLFFRLLNYVIISRRLLLTAPLIVGNIRVNYFQIEKLLLQVKYGQNSTKPNLSARDFSRAKPSSA